MMQINLNLLSPGKKSRQLSLVKSLFIKENLEITTFTACLLGIIYLASWFFLTNFLLDLTKSTILVNRESTAHSQEIKNVNLRIQKLKQASQNYFSVLPKLLQIINDLPGNIKLRALYLDQLQNNLNLSGVALTRDNLLQYQKALSNLPWIASITTPPSQLFLKENVNFELTVKLKKGE